MNTVTTFSDLEKLMLEIQTSGIVPKPQRTQSNLPARFNNTPTQVEEIPTVEASPLVGLASIVERLMTIVPATQPSEEVFTPTPVQKPTTTPRVRVFERATELFD